MDMTHGAPGYSASGRQKMLAAAEVTLPDGEAKASVARVNALLRSQLPAGPIAIYEAGGGSSSFLDAALLERAEITVLDIDADQIGNNAYADEKILGDLQTHRFDAPRFDLAVCYNVIEHVEDVPAALGNVFDAVKPGGLVLVGAPNPNSLSGVVTRYTPHWFHVWYYRRILGKPNAGRNGEAPFRTIFHPLVAPDRLTAFAQSRGFEVLYAGTYESPRYPEMRQTRPWLAGLVDALAGGINAAGRHRRNVRHGDYHVVLRKR